MIQKVQTKQPYIPSMSSSKYETDMSQMEKKGTLNPDAQTFFNQAVEEKPTVVSNRMMQISLKEGLKQRGKKARESMKSRTKQLYLWNTFEPRHQTDLTNKENAEVLESHVFLKLKRDGNIKVRTVAVGNIQQDFISKEDAIFPTVATEAVLLTCVIDAQEGRYDAIIDILNAFI